MKKRVVVIALLLATIVGGAIYIFRTPVLLLPPQDKSAIGRVIDNSYIRSAESGQRLAEVTPKKSTNSTTWNLLIFTTAVLAFAWLLFYFFSRRRRDLLQSPHLVTPENFGKWTGSVSESIKNVANALLHLSEHIKASQESHRQSVVDLSETFLTLNKAIEQRDQQIRKAEQGWERQVFKRFLVRFARVDQTINDSSIEPIEVVRQARALMSDALSECDVHPWVPPIGSDYRKANGVDDSPLLVPTNEPSLFYSIKRVITPGYRLSAPDQDDVIVIPAKVEVYSPSESVNA